VTSREVKALSLPPFPRDAARELARGDARAALEQHVLEVVGDAGQPRRVLAPAGRDIGIVRDDRRAPLLHMCHAQPVRQGAQRRAEERPLRRGERLGENLVRGEAAGSGGSSGRLEGGATGQHGHTGQDGPTLPRGQGWIR
jgi:hypothetical protein